MIKNLNIRAKTIKHSEENRDVNVNVGLGNDFLDMIQKHKHRNKNRQFGIIKIKTFTLQRTLSIK